jgi:hypothetical protein
MFFECSSVFWHRSHVLGPAPLLLALLVPVGCADSFGETTSTQPKHIIGATAVLTEVSTGISFDARIDTGAKTCSLDVEEMEIKDEARRRSSNVGKPIRFLVKGKEGKSKWIETTIAGAVRIRSSSQTDGKYDHRYKVRLTFEWKGFRKEVLVTLNDRGRMDYPLLVGRDYLRDDFLVDVAQDNED